MLTPLRCLLLFSASLLAPLASAQTVLFADDFEDGPDNWTLSPMFQWLPQTDLCIAPITPIPSRPFVMRYGGVGCSFEETQTGSMILDQDVSVPANAQNVWLSFWSYEDAEPGFEWDFRHVYVSSNGGATWTFEGECLDLYQWYQKGIDLSHYAGMDIRIQFFFDPVDFWINEGLGWVIDDVRLLADICDTTSYCAATPNSTGQEAVLSASGSTMIGANDLRLQVTSGPPTQWTAILVGPNPAMAPFGDGFLCLGPGASGIHRVIPAIQLDGAGNLDVAIDNGIYPLGNGAPAWVTPGSTWRFQARFRDPLGPGGTGLNFSTALAVTFCP